MSGFELIAVVVFFLVGYWVVDFLWPKKKKPPDDSQDSDPPGSANQR